MEKPHDGQKADYGLVTMVSTKVKNKAKIAYIFAKVLFSGYTVGTKK